MAAAGASYGCVGRRFSKERVARVKKINSLQKMVDNFFTSNIIKVIIFCNIIYFCTVFNKIIKYKNKKYVKKFN